MGGGGEGGGVMYKVFGLRPDPNFGVQLATDKNFYLRLTDEKLLAFVVCNKKH